MANSTEILDSVDKLAAPRTTKQLRGFIGMMSWHRRFIAGYTKKVVTLQRLLKAHPTNLATEWKQEHQTGFEG